VRRETQRCLPKRAWLLWLQCWRRVPRGCRPISQWHPAVLSETLGAGGFGSRSPQQSPGAVCTGSSVLAEHCRLKPSEGPGSRVGLLSISGGWQKPLSRELPKFLQWPCPGPCFSSRLS